MSEMPVVVLDPGHGGPRATRNRGSSWNRAEGPNGLLEKNVTFDLALRVAARLRDRARVELTRTEQANPSLAERAEVARRANARLFLSLHLNGSADPEADGTDVYVAHDAGAHARAFADGVWRRLRAVTHTTSGGLGARDIGTLVTARHSPSTAACLAEIAYLTNPRQAGALADEGYRNQIADALSEAIREHLAPPTMAQELAVGDGSPFVREALTQCWGKCQQLRLGASAATAPNHVAAKRIRGESGVAVDANPYVGIGQNEIEAVIRAGFTSHAMPEVLLAIWAKEGSTRSVTTAVPIPQATSDANARAIFRSKVYYEDLGADHFLVTTRAGSGTDNVFDDSDAAAPGHETHFAQRVAQLVTDRFLSENIAGAINAELIVTQTGGVRSVLPSTRFYALSLLLVDALWAKFKAATRPLLSSISDPMNYLQWNMGAASFDAFLRSANSHRGARTIEQWALHSTPAAHEYQQPRRNAIKFLHYIESYQAIFATWMNLIKPGIEDLRSNSHAAEAEVGEELAIPTFANTHLLPIAPEWVRMPIVVDNIDGYFPTRSVVSRDVFTTEADLRTRLPGVTLIPDPAAALNFFEVQNTDVVLDSLLFRSTGGNIEASLESLMCYPSDPADPNRLAASSRPFPVAIIVHGNLTPVVTGRTLTPTAPPVPFPIPILGPLTITPARVRATGVFDNHSGFSYLQEELARFGFVSMSISTNGANQLNLNLEMRARYILQYLDQLKRFASTPGNRFQNRLDFSRVALIGHSRGGDAVVTAVGLNAARLPVSSRCGIQSVVSISPTDMTGTFPVADRRAVEIRDVGHFLVLYGSHDGDISGSGDGSHGVDGSGFRLYDRSNTHRAMVFIHGANHNQFNSRWTTNDATPALACHPACPAAVSQRTIQQDLAKEYVAGWLRFSMLGDFPQANLFNGTTANARGVDVSLMWKFGIDLKTIDRYQDTDPTHNTLAGGVTAPAYVTEVEIDVENPPDAACHLPSPPAPAGAVCRLPTFPHVDRVIKASLPAGTRAPLREEIPAGPHRNFDVFTHLTFRVTKSYPITDQTTIDGADFPNFTITLEDSASPPHRKMVTNADILAANPRKVKPRFRRFTEFGVTNRNITKCNMETWKVPLSLFKTGTGALSSLAGIRAVEFDFSALANQPIYVDTISLVKL